MSLITSISGIRGTIGGTTSEGLNPINIASFTAAYATFIRTTSPVGARKIVVGRDARISGNIVKSVVSNTLVAMGFDVVDIDFATTPTVEMAVVYERADGGIIITASHNPKHWNALKMLNHRGEFLDAAAGQEVLAISTEGSASFSDVEHLGTITCKDYTDRHIQDVLALPEVDVAAIKAANLSVVVDCVNSVGAVIVPKLLQALRVQDVTLLYDDLSGCFAHNPEPLPQHLEALSDAVRTKRASIGFAVDPDVDRLAIVSEDGSMFGEENTLVAIADFLLEQYPAGASTVSNLSSSRALRDVTVKHSGSYHAAAVGEVNVVAKMKEVGALIGGEGNGGVIYPKLHYGRDALVGIALFLTMMAKRGASPCEIRATLPSYFMAKKKVELQPSTDIDKILASVIETYKSEQITTIDGVKIDFVDKWVHLRKSNTEPIIRVYAEAPTQEAADAIADELLRFLSR